MISRSFFSTILILCAYSKQNALYKKSLYILFQQNLIKSKSQKKVKFITVINVYNHCPECFIQFCTYFLQLFLMKQKISKTLSQTTVKRQNQILDMRNNVADMKYWVLPKLLSSSKVLFIQAAYSQPLMEVQVLGTVNQRKCIKCSVSFFDH